MPSINPKISLGFVIFFIFLLTFFLLEEGSESWSPGVLLVWLVIVYKNFKSNTTLILNELVYESYVYIILLLLAYAFYIYPLSPEYIRVDDPVAFFDSQKYSLSAQMLLESGSGLGHWLSIGIQYYIFIIYWLFGINEMNVMAFNIGLLIMSITVINKILIKEGGYSSLVIVIPLIPLTLFYTFQPSKEILSIFGVSIFISFLVRYGRLNLKNKIYTIALFFLMFFVRINLAVFLVVYYIVNQLLASRRKYSKYIYLVLSSVVLIYAVSFFSNEYMEKDLGFWIEKLLLLGSPSERLEFAVQISNTEDRSSLAFLIKSFLSPDNVFLALLLLPIKMIIVWVSPFPLLGGITRIPLDIQGIPVYIHTLFSSISGILNIIILPAIFKIIGRWGRLGINTKHVLIFSLVYLAIIAFAYPTQFTRHRVIVEIPIYIIFLTQSALYLQSYRKFVILFSGVVFYSLLLFLVLLIINFGS
jgi:hypothetical protein